MAENPTKNRKIDSEGPRSLRYLLAAPIASAAPGVEYAHTPQSLEASIQKMAARNDKLWSDAERYNNGIPPALRAEMDSMDARMDAAPNRINIREVKEFTGNDVIFSRRLADGLPGTGAGPAGFG